MATEKLLNYSGLEKYNDLIHGELDNKSNIDGYYEAMTVGNAEQLVGTTFEEDQTPYNFRTSGGSMDIGDREYLDAIIGGTVAWNQLARPMESTYWSVSTGASATVSFSDGVATVEVSAQGNGVVQKNAYRPTIPSGHKVLTSASVKLSSATDEVRLFVNNVPKYTTATTSWQDVSMIVNWDSSQVNYAGVFDRRASGWDSYQVKNFIEIDLTAMFGTTIADYIYSLEQANAGAGVAWFKKLFPKDYYAYNAGELMSVNASSHDMVGFNQMSLGRITNGAYNKSVGAQLPLTPTTATISGTNPISMVCVDWGGAVFWSDRVVVGQQYELKFGVTGGSSRITVYTTDENGVVVRRLGNSSEVASLTTKITVGQGEVYIAVSISTASAATMLITNLCCHLVWDGERDGEYEPYVKRSYALDSDLELRGIPKLDASNNLYYDGDTYESDGTVTRKYEIVDLGTLTWRIGSTSGGGAPRMVGTLADAKGASVGSEIPNMLCFKYQTVSANQTYSRVTGVSDNLGGGVVVVFDSNYTDPAAFKTAMSGVYLVYELATPTTEEAEPYQQTQVVDDFGTEEFVDAGNRDVAIPVGHITRYAPNLRAKLEMSPNSPDGDGDYIVRQTDGENSYIPLVIPNELPAMPSANGTYRLIVTVSDGTPTLSWVAE